MKRLFILMMILLAFSAAHAQECNGNWKLDAGKTDFHGLPNWSLPAGYDISQDKPGHFLIIRAVLGTDNTITHRDTLKLSIGGLPFENYSASHKKQVFTIQKTDDQKGILLIIHSFFPDGKPYLAITENLQLSAGDILTVDRKVDQLDDGSHYEIKGFYTKQ